MLRWCISLACLAMLLSSPLLATIFAPEEVVAADGRIGGPHGIAIRTLPLQGSLSGACQVEVSGIASVPTRVTLTLEIFSDDSSPGKVPIVSIPVLIDWDLSSGEEKSRRWSTGFLLAPELFARARLSLYIETIGAATDAGELRYLRLTNLVPSQSATKPSR